MRFLFLVLAIIFFVVTAIIALTGGSWDSFSHLIALVCVGLAFFAASFLPLPGVTPVP